MTPCTKTSGAEAPAVKPEHLGTLQTLRQIVAHLEAGVQSTVTAAPATPEKPAMAAGKAEQVLLDVTSLPMRPAEADEADEAIRGFRLVVDRGR